MRIGAPGETQDNELRVHLTPEGARRLVEAGHEVAVETGAGAGSGFPDHDYLAAGATIASSAPEAWAADLVVKVKQPSREECALFADGSAYFGYTHTEERPWLVAAFLRHGITAISCERLGMQDGARPDAMKGMGRIAGHMSVIIGAQLLQSVDGGPGVMLGEVPGLARPRVVVIGGGAVGATAAQAADALGAEVTIFELHEKRRAQLRDLLPAVTVEPPEPDLVAAAVREAWSVINGATVPMDSDVHVVTREMVREMKDGAVIVDVTASARGAIETSVRETTHTDPTFIEEGVVHYVVPNIPGVVPRTATLVFEAQTLTYLLKLANMGIEAALADDPGLAAALLCGDGKPVAPDIEEMARARPEE